MLLTVPTPHPLNPAKNPNPAYQYTLSSKALIFYNVSRGHATRREQEHNIDKTFAMRYKHLATRYHLKRDMELARTTHDSPDERFQARSRILLESTRPETTHLINGTYIYRLCVKWNRFLT